MAVKITGLTPDTAPISTDLIETVKDPGGTPLSRKVTFANAIKALVAGSDTEVQYNDGGIQAGDDDLAWDDVAKVLAVGLSTVTAQLSLPDSNDATSPTLAFGTSGIYKSAPNVLSLSLGGVTVGVLVGGTATQALTNKTINTASNTITVVEADISDLQAYLLDITGEALSTLSDVTISAIASGELLKWNGSAWINNTLAEAGISATGHTHNEADIDDLQAYILDITGDNLSALADATITDIASGELLKWNGSAWINNTIAEAAIAAASHAHGAGDITSGTLVHEQGGLEADVKDYDGLVKISGGSTSAVALPLTHENGGLEADVSSGDGFTQIKGGSTTVTKTKHDGSAAPDSDNDTTEGYVVGSRWIDTTNDKEYVCLDNTDTAAVWTETTQAGSSPAMNDITDVTISSVANDEVLAYDSGGDWINQTAAEAGLAAASHVHAAGDITSGTLVHEQGGLEFDASAVDDGDVIVGTAAGTMAIRADVLTGGAAGFLKHEVGGLEADVNAGDGFVEIKGGSTAVIKTKHDASAAPDADNDTTEGYVVGSRWIDTTNDKEYVCLDNTDTAAVWTETTQAGSSPALNDISDVTIDSVANNEVLAYDTGGDWINQTAAEAGLATASHVHAAGDITSGTLAHEQGGLEFDASAVDNGDVVVGTAAGTMAIRADVLTGGAAGFLKHEVGGLEADVNAGDGFVEIKGGSTTVIKSNLAASDAPDSNDDVTPGYQVGSVWIDTTADKAYVCLDPADGAAVWTEITQAGSSPAMDDISDCTITSVTSGELLEWSGSAWVNQTLAEIGIEVAHSYEEFYIDAAAMVAKETNGAEAATEEYASNEVMSDHYLFDGAGSTKEAVQFKLAMPDRWDLGTVKVKFYWDAATGASASDTVNWECRGQAIANGSAIDESWGTLQEVTDTVTAVGELHVSAATAAIEIANVTALADLVFLEVARDPANDTMDEDAKLLGIQVQYGVLAAPSSGW